MRWGAGGGGAYRIASYICDYTRRGYTMTGDERGWGALPYIPSFFFFDLPGARPRFFAR